VGQTRENCPFALEPLFAGAADQGRIQQLQRGLAFETAVAALRQPDAAHSAVTDRRHQPIGADGHPRQRRFWRRHDRPAVEESLGAQLAVLGQHGLDVGGDFRLRRPQLPQADGAVGCG